MSPSQMVIKEKPRKRPRVPPNSATFRSKYLHWTFCKWNETDQGGEGVDQFLRLNRDVGGRVPENQAKTIVRGTLKRIHRIAFIKTCTVPFFFSFTKGLPKNLNSL